MKTLDLLLCLAAVSCPLVARADYQQSVHVDHADLTLPFQHPTCGQGSVRITVEEVKLLLNTTGDTRKANDQGIVRQDVHVESMTAVISTFDSRCRTVFDSLVLSGVDVETDSIDGTSTEKQVCLDEDGADPTRTCRVHGVNIGNGHVTIVGRFVTKAGHVLDLNVHMDATDQQVYWTHFSLNSALLRYTQTSQQPGDAPYTVTITDTSGAWDPVREQLRDKEVYADLRSKSTLDGIALLEGDASTSSVDVHFSTPDLGFMPPPLP